MTIYLKNNNFYFKNYYFFSNRYYCLIQFDEIKVPCTMITKKLCRHHPPGIRVHILTVDPPPWSPDQEYKPSCAQCTRAVYKSCTTQCTNLTQHRVQLLRFSFLLSARYSKYWIIGSPQGNCSSTESFQKACINCIISCIKFT